MNSLGVPNIILCLYSGTLDGMPLHIIIQIHILSKYIGLRHCRHKNLQLFACCYCCINQRVIQARDAVATPTWTQTKRNFRFLCFLRGHRLTICP